MPPNYGSLDEEGETQELQPGDSFDVSTPTSLNTEADYQAAFSTAGSGRGVGGFGPGSTYQSNLPHTRIEYSQDDLIVKLLKPALEDIKIKEQNPNYNKPYNPTIDSLLSNTSPHQVFQLGNRIRDGKEFSEEDKVILLPKLGKIFGKKAVDQELDPLREKQALQKLEEDFKYKESWDAKKSEEEAILKKQKEDEKLEKTQEEFSQKLKKMKPTLTEAKRQYTSGGSYSEDAALSSDIDNALTSNPALDAMKNLHSMSPEERADKGAKFGMAVGLKNAGPIGSLIGAGVGAMAGRAAGIVQSGEHSQNEKKKQVLDTFSKLGILDKSTGMLSVEDPDEKKTLKVSPTSKLKNMFSISGKKERELFEIDTGNPFSNRTVQVVTPLARYISEGLLKHKDKKTVDATVGALTNYLQDGAMDIQTVYSRAREVAAKLGVDETQLTTFLQTLPLDQKQVESMEIGIKNLFPK